MKRTAMPILALAAACSPAPEPANTSEINESAAAAPAKMIVEPEAKSPAKIYADATAAYNSFARAAGTVAKEKATNPSVRKYAEMIYKEHLQFGLEFKLASGRVSGLLPNPTLSPEQQKNLEALQQASGKAFDQAFVAQQLAAHREMLPVQRAYAQIGDEDALKAFADRYSRWVQRHLRLGGEL